ncbi:MAG: carbohydrate kinase family protein [bacterium]|nr:carbohydrate kinase family protein [Acidimicrobiia bacterium]MCY4651254.1 carbohydrate kinase family protein [bacterium]
MEQPSLLVYGDASVDISLRVNSLPAAGLDTAARDQVVTAGGSAANCAATAARLGARVDLVARVGDDLFSQIVMDDLAAHQVGTSAIQIIRGPPALVISLVHPDGQRTFVSCRGPASGRIPADAYLSLLDKAAVVHLSGYSFQDPGSRSTALHLMDEARRMGIGVSLDPSPLFAEGFDPSTGWLDRIDYLFPNLYEATALTGASSPEDAAGALHSLGIGIVVVTMGDRGCMVKSQHGLLHIPAVREFPVVDTAGAGDGFAAGFLTATLSGGSAHQAARVANLVAARTIAHRGAHTGAPSVAELLQVTDRLGDAGLREAAQALGTFSERTAGGG